MVQSVFDVHNATFYKNPKPSDGLDACAVYLTGMRPASYESLPAFIPNFIASAIFTGSFAAEMAVLSKYHLRQAPWHDTHL